MFQHASIRAQKQAQSWTPITSGLLQRKCDECRKKKPTLQRSTFSPAPEAVPPIVHDVLRSPGEPLDPATRAFMEPRFGHSFANVKVHDDSGARKSAQMMGARVYTVGEHMVLGKGEHSPVTDAGRRLIAHELAHVVQQSIFGRPTIAASMHVSNPGDAGEREADAVASAVISARGWAKAAQGIHHIEPCIQRLGDSSKVPRDLSCEVGMDSPADPLERLMFANEKYVLDSEQRRDIDNFVVNWHAAGVGGEVRVDGYASRPGTDEFNWRLSCNRAQAVVAELKSPSSGSEGVLAGSIRTIAHGETDEFGAEGMNRRATISSLLALPKEPKTPASECEPGYDKSYWPSQMNCEAYNSPLAKQWLTWTYRHNATCACENTPDDPKNNCVRKCLQAKMTGFLLRQSRSGGAIGTCLDPLGILDPVCPEPYCRDLYRHHVECYKECCCKKDFIAYPAFLTMCEFPFPCSLVGRTIKWTNRCR